jgi:hypothetical protein
MIARIWRGAVLSEDSDAYADYMQDPGVAGYARTPGNRGVWMLRRDLGDRTEFVMFTLWDSIEASRRSRARPLGTTLSRQRRCRARACAPSRRERGRTPIAGHFGTSHLGLRPIRPASGLPVLPRFGVPDPRRLPEAGEAAGARRRNRPGLRRQPIAPPDLGESQPLPARSSARDGIRVRD